VLVFPYFDYLKSIVAICGYHKLRIISKTKIVNIFS